MMCARRFDRRTPWLALAIGVLMAAPAAVPAQDWDEDDWNEGGVRIRVYGDDDDWWDRDAWDIDVDWDDDDVKWDVDRHDRSRTWRYDTNYEPWSARERYGYRFAQRFRGTVLDIARFRADGGEARSVRLRVRDDEGRIRIVHVGDPVVLGDAPRIHRGERVRLRGTFVRIDGQPYFDATQIRPVGEGFALAGDEDLDEIRGEVLGLESLGLRGGALRSLVALVRTDEGEQVDVLLGAWHDLRRDAGRVRRGDRVLVDGRVESIDGRAMFYASDLRLIDEDWRTSRVRTYRTPEYGAKRVYVPADVDTEETYVPRVSVPSAQLLRGEIDDIWLAPRLDRMHVLATVDVDDQDMDVTVDLGPAAGLRGIDLDDGDDITVHGFSYYEAGRLFFVANYVETEDESRQIERY